MPGISCKKIKMLIKCTKEAGPVVRLEAALLRKREYSIRDIAETLGFSYTAVRLWLHALHKDGIKARFPKKPPGAKQTLNRKERKLLKLYMEAGPQNLGFDLAAWHLRDIQCLVELIFGFVIHPRTLRRHLKKIRYSYRKPRPVPHRTASEEVQNETKQKIVNTVVQYEETHTAFFLDEAGIVTGVGGGYGWRQTGGHDVVTTGFGRKVCKIFGALSADDLELHATDKLNSSEFISFVKTLYKKHGPIILIVDNATYHKSKMVKEFIKTTNGGIILVFLPSRTPQLNEIEIQWRVIKNLTAGIYLESKEMLMELLARLQDSNTLNKVAMPKWMSECLSLSKNAKTYVQFLAWLMWQEQQPV